MLADFFFKSDGTEGTKNQITASGIFGLGAGCSSNSRSNALADTAAK